METAGLLLRVVVALVSVLSRPGVAVLPRHDPWSRGAAWCRG